MHKPVLLEEVLQGLALRPDGIYVDATFGRGGHSREILARLGKAGRLFVIDKDPQAIQFAHEQLGDDARCVITQGSFTTLQSLAKDHGVVGCVDGILLDLGVSSPQLDDAERGFSFLREGPLDMRMDTSQEVDAATWLHQATAPEIARVLRDYGEERYAKRIANFIVTAREKERITTTTQLANIVAAAQPRQERHKHPATRTFQAIRIFINGELDELEQCLQQCLHVLGVSGRLLVISFHSLEDRIVKHFMRSKSKSDEFPAKLPIAHKDLPVAPLRCIGRAIKPMALEIADNPRARSAILRIAEKVK